MVNSPPEQGHRLRNIIASGAVGTLAVVGINKVWQDNECKIQLMAGNFGSAASCAFGGKDSSEGKMEALDMQSQSLVNKDLNLTFGTVAIEMGGEAEFGYDGPWYRNAPGVTDVKKYYNQGNRNTTKVIALLGVRFGSDYETALDVNAKTPDDGKSVVKASYRLAPDGRSIEEVIINAGTLDFKLPHVAQTAENELLFNPRGVNAGTMPGKVEGAYRFAIKDMITHAAMAQSCPEELLNMQKIEDAIATLAKGMLGKTDLEQQMINKAYEDNLVTVKLKPPSDRQEHYEDIFQNKRAEYANGTAEAFKNAPDIKKFTVNDITVKSCSVSDALPTDS